MALGSTQQVARFSPQMTHNLSVCGRKYKTRLWFLQLPRPASPHISHLDAGDLATLGTPDRNRVDSCHLSASVVSTGLVHDRRCLSRYMGLLDLGIGQERSRKRREKCWSGTESDEAEEEETEKYLRVGSFPFQLSHWSQWHRYQRRITSSSSSSSSSPDFPRFFFLFVSSIWNGVNIWSSFLPVASRVFVFPPLDCLTE